VVALLHDGIIAVMKSSLETGGASFATYRSPTGEVGQASRRFAVYGHDSDPAGREVKNEETPDGRTSWWVPEVQK
jgi:formamidopyrimidine-DNA glycosylase